MKTIIKISLALILVGFFIPFMSAQAAGNAIMRLTSAKTDYYVGDNIYVQIQVETNGETLNTVRSVMDFSGSAVLQVSDFAIGTAFPNQSPGKELNNTTQHINVGGFILVDSVSQNSLFGTLIFKANQVGTSIISFATGSHLISPNQEEKINLAGCQGITINVIGTPPPPPPQNQAPVFQAVGNKQINLGEAVNFHVSATDSDNGDKVSLTWNIPAGSIFNNVINNAVTVGGDFSWTPTVQGIYTTTFTATDDNADSKSATLSVNIGVNVAPPPQNHPPIFEPVAEKTVNAGETITFNISATDPDGNKVILSLEPLDTAIISPITQGITSTSKFTWTPQNFGIYYAVFKATDDFVGNSLAGTLTVRITVFGGKCPPCGGGGGGSCPICECEKQKFSKDLEKAKPTITSPSHSNQDIWYADNSPKFVWEVSDMPIGYSFNLDQNPTADPSIGYYFTNNKAFNFGNISDGIWYLHLKAKYLDGWGPTAHYQVKIDTTPPEFFKPSIEEKGAKKQNQIYFSALDKSSGIAYYEMKIDNGNWQKVLSPFTITASDQNGKILTLRAVDNAGNAIESYVDLPKMAPLEKTQLSYNIKEVLLLAPVITKVIMPQQVGNEIVNDQMIVIGQSIPNAKIFLHILASPESIFNTESDGDGFWEVIIKKTFNEGKYALYAIANKDGINSLPSEKVYFTISEKHAPVAGFKVIWDYIYIIIIVIVAGALIVILRYIDRKINMIKKHNFKHGKNKKNY